MSLNPQDDIGDKATPPIPGADRKAPEDPVWDSSLLPGRPPRPAAHVRFDLELALAYKERYQHRATADRWVRAMRDDNESDIERLKAELAAAEVVESAVSPETPEESAFIDDDDDERSARVGYGRGIADRGAAAGDVPGGGRQGHDDRPHWPRRGKGAPGADVGL